MYMYITEFVVNSVVSDIQTRKFVVTMFYTEHIFYLLSHDTSPTTLRNTNNNNSFLVS